ncbi:MAG: DinB family protein [Armatimonadota bacterium]|nr:DinB family protein [Armatimonadota bacterium]
MDPWVAPYLRVLEDLRAQLLDAVRGLDDAQLNRAVPGLRNTAGMVLRHVAGSERYWVGEVAGGRPAHRDREAEFGPDPVRKTEVLAEIDRVAAATRQVLERLAAADLMHEVEVRRAQGTGRETKAGALLHAIQHLAYHLGQIRYLVKLLQTP